MGETERLPVFERVYLVVQQVPRGMVASYGDVAAVVGEGCDARTVGYALNALSTWRDAEVPWQRIINGQGGISTPGTRQRRLLEEEDVAFDAHDRVDMRHFRWPGPEAAWAAEHDMNMLPPREGSQNGPEAEANQLRLF